MSMPRHIGVLLAAGRGSRMGCTKQLKLWPATDGPKPLICAAYDAIRPVCDEIVLVLGHDAEKVGAALASRPFERAFSSADVAMGESICAGLRAAAAIDARATVVLQPGDHPEVAERTLRMLISESLMSPTQAVIPTYYGRGGHPAFIPGVVVQKILATSCPEGLKQFWADFPLLSRRLAVEDPSVVRDVDTPADLPI
jgi:molybdenum cofactor cytidylyltransferase